MIGANERRQQSCSFKYDGYISAQEKQPWQSIMFVWVGTSNYLLTTSGGYDVGTLTVGDVALTIWNEYMTAEKSGQRIYTFPDLIMTFDQDTGYPITSAELSQGRNVVIIAARSEHLPLGSPMKDPKVLALIEPVIGKKIV